MEREAPPRAEALPARVTEGRGADPAVSMKRILERGLLGVPFHDPDTGRLSAAALADVLVEVGEDPVPAMAFARVVVEAVEPEDFYAPLWAALGGTGPVDLEALAQRDWSALRPKPDGPRRPEVPSAGPPPVEPRSAGRRPPPRKPSAGFSVPKTKGPR